MIPRPYTLLLIGLAMSFNASADVIYSNLLDTTIPLEFNPGATINIGSGNFNFFFGGVGVANSSAIQPLRVGTGGLDTIRNVEFGSWVSSSSTFLSTGDGGSQDHVGTTFTAGQEGYIGFKLNDANFGWLRVILTNNTGGAVVKDWAYDTTGSAISVGGIRQDGQNITLSSGFNVSSNLADRGGATHLVQTGDFTNRLTGTNTLSGNVIVDAGTLVIGGAGSINQATVQIQGGTFLYDSSANFTGNLQFNDGVIGGTNFAGNLGGLSIGQNQTISPGDGGTGTLETLGQTWAENGRYRFEMGDALGIAGDTNGWDLITGSGSLQITANQTNPFIIDLHGLGINGAADGFDAEVDQSWLIADFGSISDFSESSFMVNASGFDYDPQMGIFRVLQGGGSMGGDSSQLFLSYAVIPEPRVVTLLPLAALAMLRRRKKQP